MKDVQDLYIKRQNMEKEMASHSSILAWEIPRTEEPGGIGSHKESDWQHSTERQRLAADGGQGHPWITGGTPVLDLHWPPAAWGALEGHWQGSAAELRSIPGITPVRGPQEVILDLPHPQCLPRTRFWVPIAAVNHSSRKKKK